MYNGAAVCEGQNTHTHTHMCKLVRSCVSWEPSSPIINPFSSCFCCLSVSLYDALDHDYGGLTQHWLYWPYSRGVCRQVCACVLHLLPTLWLKARVQQSYIPFWHFDRHQAISIPLCPASSATLLHFSLLLDQRKSPSRHEDCENEMYRGSAIPESYAVWAFF